MKLPRNKLINLLLFIAISLLTFGCGLNTGLNTNATAEIGRVTKSITLNQSGIDLSKVFTDEIVNFDLAQPNSKDSVETNPFSCKWIEDQATFTAELAGSPEITGDTASAPVKFTFAGKVGLTHRFTNITITKSFLITGFGTVKFIRVGGEWRVLSMPDDLLLKTGTSAPDIKPLSGESGFITPDPAEAGKTVSFRASVEPVNSSANPSDLIVVAGTTAGIGGVKLFPGINGTGNYEFTAAQQLRTNLSKGIYKGSVVAIDKTTLYDGNPKTTLGVTIQMFTLTIQ